VRSSTIAFTSLGVASVASGVLASFLPLYVFGLTGSDFTAAAISSIPAVSAIVMAPLWGALKDRSVSVRPLMLLGVLPYAALSFFVLSVKNVPQIFTAWSLATLLTSSTTPVFAAYVTAGEARRGSSIGLLVASSATGGAVGAMVGGVTYQWYDLNIAFLLGGVSTLISGFMILWGVKEKREPTAQSERQQDAVVTLKVILNTDLLKPCISCFSYMVGITAFGSLASIYVVKILGGTRFLWGASSTLAYILGALTAATTLRLSDKLGRKTVIRAGLFAQVMLYISFIFFRDPLFVAFLIVAPLAYIVCSTITALVTDVTTERERGKAIGIQLSFLSAGGVIGPLAGGVIAEAFGFGLLIIFSIVSVAFSLLWLQAKVSRPPAPVKHSTPISQKLT